ncbi:MAG: D-ribose pyranase [Bacilli bacterium]|jgi:D-ribose pyranase|nr:D-ribose pyranase [Bacilli bacterium]
MKKHGILNREINDVLGRLGHTDTICICDCGLPLPEGVKVVDLSIRLNQPKFIDVLNLIIEEMEIEKIILAYEISDDNPLLDKEIQDKFPIDVRNYVSHEQLKELTKKCKLIIRTGEATPFANIILQSGVIF